MAVRKRIWTTRKDEEREAWVVDYTDHTGKRRFETFTRKGDADSRAAKIKVDLGKGTHVALDGKATVADVAETWIRRLEAEGLQRCPGAATLDGERLRCVHQPGSVSLAAQRFGDPHEVHVHPAAPEIAGQCAQPFAAEVL